MKNEGNIEKQNFKTSGTEGKIKTRKSPLKEGLYNLRQINHWFASAQAVFQTR